MKKQKIICAILTVFIIGGIGVFFRPLSLSDKVKDTESMSIVFQEIGVKNGEPFIDSVDYSSITQEQEKAILDLMKQYPCRRTMAALFSDGSLTDMGDVLLFYMYGDRSKGNSFIVSSSGQIAISNKNYRMKNAEQFIEKVMEVLN